MEIKLVEGIYTDEKPDYRNSYPVNMVPIALSNGISNGYLRPAEGIVAYGTGPGIDRGGITWNNTCYRVMGSKLVSIPSGGGAATVIGDVGGTTSQCNFDYSFDYLAVASNGNLFLYDGTTLTQNTDADLGTVLDLIYVDGYFMTTDGEFLVVTDLGNPFSVNPLKYGSSELDPDPVVGLLKINNEPYAINRHTIEVFQNVGGTLFPFNRIDGTRIDRGAVGSNAFCYYMERIAFLGSGRNEENGIYLGTNAGSEKISTREIDKIISEYSELELSTVLLERRVVDRHQFLYVHLPNETIVFDGETSRASQRSVWFKLSSSITGSGAYRARNFTWCDDKWLCGDTQSSNYGYMSDDVSTHYGSVIGWQCLTPIIYNESNGAIIHELELVSLTGRVPLGINPTIWTSYSTDGENWSQERPISAGMIGERDKRLVWRRQGFLRNARMQRFRGTSDAHIAISRLEAQIEGLNH